MITLTQINEASSNNLTDEEVFILENLVKSYKPYVEAVGRWPNLHTALLDEQEEATVKTKALHAILTALDELPSIVVESNGSDAEPGYFSTQNNWGSLAQDVLNTMFDIPVTLGANNYALIQRKISDLVLNESGIVTEQQTGKRY